MANCTQAMLCQQDNTWDNFSCWVNDPASLEAVVFFRLVQDAASDCLDTKSSEASRPLCSVLLPLNWTISRRTFSAKTVSSNLPIWDIACCIIGRWFLLADWGHLHLSRWRKKNSWVSLTGLLICSKFQDNEILCIGSWMVLRGVPIQVRSKINLLRVQSHIPCTVQWKFLSTPSNLNSFRWSAIVLLPPTCPMSCLLMQWTFQCYKMSMGRNRFELLPTNCDCGCLMRVKKG